MSTPTQVYLEKARSKYRMLEQSAEELPTSVRPFATAALAELSLALNMLETTEPPARSRDPKQLRGLQSRTEMLQELMEDAAFYRTIVEDLPAGVAVLDSEGRLVHVNRTATNALGYEFDELVSSRATELVHPDDRAKADRNLDELLDGRRRAASESVRVRKKSGEWLHTGVVAQHTSPASPLEGVLVTGSCSAEEQTDDNGTKSVQARLDQLGILRR